MLILSRKVGEVIKIGDEITLHVIDISKGFVKLGIEAPENVTILREEVYERILEANLESAQGGISGLFKAADILKKTEKKES